MNVLANEVARQLDAAVAETAEDDSIRAMVV
jgi:enoyl-CoA hydratase/carnithine racemase